MLKKLLCFLVILFISMSLLSVSYGTEVVMDIDNSTQTTDNTIYTQNPDEQYTQDLVTDYEQAATTTTTDYESEAELSISNIINIVLISIGIVLILLGIAIIIKLK